MSDFVFPMDDAYITLHNAQVILTGNDGNYGVPALVGASSPAHLLLVFVLGEVLPLPIASLTINAAAICAYICGLVWLARLAKTSPFCTVAMVAVGVAPAAIQLFNGLETGLALAAATWAIVLSLRNSRIAFPILAGALPFVRPDLAALSLCLLVWRSWRSWATVSSPREWAWRSLQDGALTALAALPWLIWSYETTGSFFPLTIAAKKAFFAEGAMPMIGKLNLVEEALIGSGLLLSLVFLPISRKSPLCIPLCAYVTLFLLNYLCFLPGGLSHNSYRYLCVLLPVGAYAVAFAPTTLVVQIAAAVAAALSIAQVPGQYVRFREFQSIVRDGFEASRWASIHLPARSRVLVHDAGVIAVETELKLVDVVGLKTPSSIAENVHWTEPSAGAERGAAINAIALKNRVSYAVILNDARREHFWIQIAGDLRQHGWTLTPMRISQAPIGYDIYALTTPDDGAFGQSLGALRTSLIP